MIENEVNVLLTNEGETSGFNKLREHGYSIYHFPMIRTEPNPNACLLYTSDAADE